MNPAGSEYFLPDALGSVRQIVDASGTMVRTLSFDPYGDLLNSNGSTLTGYGFAGEWTDATGLQYLRARYYSPVTGSFLSRDPFSGSLNQPATLNAYSYAGGNPIRHTDPSGRCIDGISTVLCVAGGLVISAGIGALIGVGVDIGAQIISMHPQSPGQVFNCLNWGEVWVAAGAGAISGLAGFASFGAVTAIFGTSLIPILGAGAFSGVIAGQYGRLGQLGFSGQLSQAGEVMFQPEDMLWDAGLGGAIAGVTYGAAGIVESITSRKTTSSPFSRLPSRIGDADKTSGILVIGKNEIPLESEWSGPASKMPSKSPGFNIITKTHVEGHAAALMHQNGWTSGTLYINNLPCTSCNNLLPRMLPPSSVLRIIGPNDYENIFSALVK